jgi:hypothetical protein
MVPCVTASPCRPQLGRENRKCRRQGVPCVGCVLPYSTAERKGMCSIYSPPHGSDGFFGQLSLDFPYCGLRCPLRFCACVAVRACANFKWVGVDVNIRCAQAELFGLWWHAAQARLWCGAHSTTRDWCFCPLRHRSKGHQYPSHMQALRASSPTTQLQAPPTFHWEEDTLQSVRSPNTTVTTMRHCCNM